MAPFRNAIHIPGEVFLVVMKEKVPVNPELFKSINDRVNRVELFLNEIILRVRQFKTWRKEK
jgi:hypothetical protein